MTIVSAEADDGLNADKFIYPGLGDFGDRFYGTEWKMAEFERYVVAEDISSTKNYGKSRLWRGGFLIHNFDRSSYYTFWI